MQGAPGGVAVAFHQRARGTLQPRGIPCAAALGPVLVAAHERDLAALPALMRQALVPVVAALVRLCARTSMEAQQDYWQISAQRP